MMKIKLNYYSLNGIDTTYFDYILIRFPGSGYDSILLVRFYPGTDIAYMRLRNYNVDTLIISYEESSGKCYGRVTDITNFRLKNRFDIPGSKGTQEIKK